MSDHAPNPPLDAAAAAALLDAARQARRNAYAPYSEFPVGAALLTSGGRTIPGVNVENASYGLGTCAERTAIARAIAEGERSFRAVAVAGPRDDEACLPCGSCRQILYEFAPDIEVVVSGPSREPRIVTLRTLLPDAFGAESLAAKRERG